MTVLFVSNGNKFLLDDWIFIDQDVIINTYSTHMVYGRILYNNIKEYTPKWFPTIPYSQTTKPIFSKSW
jgi:hypothetical protein